MLAEKQKIGDYNVIWDQIGGNRFKAMTGSKPKYYGYDDNGYVYLMIELTKNKSKAKYLKIQYNSMDLYDMTFTRINKTLNKEESIPEIGYKVYDHETEVIEHIVDVYAEDLQKIFTSVTGLYTSCL